MSDSDCDWFDKDEDELLKDLQNCIKARQNNGLLEQIESNNTLEDYIKDLNLKAASKNEKAEFGKKKLNIEKLRKLAVMSHFDMFLYCHTLEYDFYSGQIQANDSQERVILYTKILAAECSLDLPGFHNVLLNSFCQDQCLQQHFRLVTAKLVCKRYKDLWKHEQEITEFLMNMELLLVQSFNAYPEDDVLKELFKDILSILERCDNVDPLCTKFCKQLKNDLKEAQNKTQNLEQNNKDIFPSIEDLLKSEQIEHISTDLTTPQQYLQSHMGFLKQDFLLPLQDCVKGIKNKSSSQHLPDNFYLFDNVFIVLNEQFVDANRHELIFVDVLGTKRKVDDDGKPHISWDLQEKLWKIKSGALLCFTTSKEFENLILATVTYTSQDCLKEGFIGIEIARQYNIGNIYNRRLLMFETPAFFEPYHNVFNYLKNCNATDFPMRKYILEEDNTPKAPAYINEDTVYECNGKNFHPLTELPANDSLKLNTSQLQAFSKALKHELVLIQGPPGTGKTHLSVQIVKTLIENAKTPLILITYTNESLDKFLVKLSDYTESIVRFGSQTRDSRINKYNLKDVVEHSLINPKLKRLYYLCSVEFKETFQKLQQQHRDFDGTDESYEHILKAQSKLADVAEKLRTLKTMFQYYVARERSIIGMTTTCAAKTNFLFRLLKSKIVVFEEAAEILESHVVACLTPHTEHVIMIGDHQQLQPYTSNYQLTQKSQMNISLFERLFTRQTNPIVLHTQYRMHPNIADLLCNTIYKELDNDKSVTLYPAIREMSTNLFFMSHNKPESKTEHDSSLYNSYEVTQVVQLALHLVQNALYETKDIQILSPYAKQIDMIRKQLQQHAVLQNLKANTVDSFQGLESNIVILSLVRSNGSSQIGFLKQSNRICVALSRAKHGMFIIGSMQLLIQCSNIWQAIEHKLRQHNAVGEKFPIESENYFYDK